MSDTLYHNSPAIQLPEGATVNDWVFDSTGPAIPDTVESKDTLTCTVYTTHSDEIPIENYLLATQCFFHIGIAIAVTALLYFLNKGLLINNDERNRNRY